MRQALRPQTWYEILEDAGLGVVGTQRLPVQRRARLLQHRFARSADARRGWRGSARPGRRPGARADSGSLVVVPVWVYYSALFFFLGAEATRAYATRLGGGIVPADNATRIASAQGEVIHPDATGLDLHLRSSWLNSEPAEREGEVGLAVRIPGDGCTMDCGTRRRQTPLNRFD